MKLYMEIDGQARVEWDSGISIQIRNFKIMTMSNHINKILIIVNFWPKLH